MTRNNYKLIEDMTLNRKIYVKVEQQDKIN